MNGDATTAAEARGAPLKAAMIFTSASRPRKKVAMARIGIVPTIPARRSHARRLASVSIRAS